MLSFKYLQFAALLSCHFQGGLTAPVFKNLDFKTDNSSAKENEQCLLVAEFTECIESETDPPPLSPEEINEMRALAKVSYDKLTDAEAERYRSFINRTERKSINKVEHRGGCCVIRFLSKSRRSRFRVSSALSKWMCTLEGGVLNSHLVYSVQCSGGETTRITEFANQTGNVKHTFNSWLNSINAKNSVVVRAEKRFAWDDVPEVDAEILSNIRLMRNAKYGIEVRKVEYYAELQRWWPDSGWRKAIYRPFRLDSGESINPDTYEVPSGWKISTRPDSRESNNPDKLLKEEKTSPSASWTPVVSDITGEDGWNYGFDWRFVTAKKGGRNCYVRKRLMKRELLKLFD